MEKKKPVEAKKRSPEVEERYQEHLKRLRTNRPFKGGKR